MSIKKLMVNYSAYNWWANTSYMNWLSTKPFDILIKEVPSSFTNIVKTLNHILATEEFWLSVVTEVPHKLERFRAETFDAEEIMNALPYQSRIFHEYIESLSEEDLLTVLHLKTSWVEGDLPRYEFLQHVFNHSSYHRGQIVTIGRNIGLTDPPMSDYNHYNMTIKQSNHISNN